MTQPDQYTADLQTLERIERDTRNHPGRALFEPLLLAQIERTRQLGPQPLNPPAIEPGQEWRLPYSQLTPPNPTDRDLDTIFGAGT